MAIQSKRPLTYDDYAALPDDGKRYQLIDGELFVNPSPSFRHQNVAGMIHTEIQLYLKTHPCGVAAIAPLDVILNPERTHTFQPDVLFIATARRQIITPQNIQGAPDLVVEVLSPGTEKFDLTKKKRAYARYGVQEYWVVWPDMARVEIYRPGESGKFGNPVLLEAEDTLTTELLPGFALPLADLYKDLPAEE